MHLFCYWILQEIESSPLITEVLVLISLMMLQFLEIQSSLLGSRTLRIFQRVRVLLVGIQMHSWLYLVAMVATCHTCILVVAVTMRQIQ